MLDNNTIIKMILNNKQLYDQICLEIEKYNYKIKPLDIVDITRRFVSKDTISLSFGIVNSDKLNDSRVDFSVEAQANDRFVSLIYGYTSSTSDGFVLPAIKSETLTKIPDSKNILHEVMDISSDDSHRFVGGAWRDCNADIAEICYGDLNFPLDLETVRNITGTREYKNYINGLVTMETLLENTVPVSRY